MSQYQQTNQPLAKGRVVYAAEHYPTQDRNQPNKQIMKARYATLGKATLWPSERATTLTAASQYRP